MAADNKRSANARNASPAPKRQRTDRSLAASASASNRNSPAPTDPTAASAANSRQSTPAVISDSAQPGEAEGTPDVDENGNDAGEVEGDFGPGEHHSLSAKSVPEHQPKPSDGRAAHPSVGGKGRKGEEALEHAVAAREEVERRRVEYREENLKTGQLPKLAVVDGVAVPVEAKVVEDEVVLVKQEDPEAQAVAEDDDGSGPVKRERPAITEERDRIIQFRVVTNDGDPASLIILAGLKNIFQKQLPKMPREYIARLVFDRNHYSMAIVKRGLEVVGGITYRPFEARQFAEIVFCAITGTEQVKGYGSHLMNHLKDYVKKSTSCMHFLTYADNYAIGYFKKQGFTKEITLDRSVWAAYIKDYEGGTIMHCSMLPRIEYLTLRGILEQQKQIVLREIQAQSTSHIVRKGLDFWQDKPPGTAIDPSDVPGLKESGWTPEMDALTRRPTRHPQFAIMQKLLTLIVDHPSSWAFANPVNADEVTDYYDRIKEPMDLATMEAKLESNTYKEMSEFLADFQRIFDNCRAYNDAQSNYVKNADKLARYLETQKAMYCD